MPIDEILTEIDSYLSVLREARELLVPITSVASKPARRKTRSRKAKPKAQKTSPGRVKKPAIKEKERPSGRRASTAARTEKRRASDPPGGTGGTVPKKTGYAEPAAIETLKATAVQQKAAPEFQTTKIRKIPAKPIRSRSAKPARAKAEKKPATALSGAMHSRIVVVSPEQVQKERQQAAAPEVRRPRAFPTGLTGKRAFEALFKESPEPAAVAEKPEDANGG